MSIDWITVAAQVANFLVLVWLLKRFLYRPILDGIDAREAEIAGRMQVAERARAEAEATEAEYRTRMDRLRSEQASVADAARQKAEAARDAMLAQAHDRIEAERLAWQAHRDHEAQDFTNRLQRAAGQALLELTRKALLDLADDALETRIAAHLARKVASMDTALQDAAGTPAAAIVTSHSALTQATQTDLTAELRRRFPEIAVRFEVNAAQAPGLSLQIGGAQLEWTVETWVDGLGALMAERLAAETSKGAVSG